MGLVIPRIVCPTCNRRLAACGGWHCPRCGLQGPPVECEHCRRELRGERVPISDYDFVMKMAEGLEEINRHRRIGELAEETRRARLGVAMDEPEPDPSLEHGKRRTYQKGCRCEDCVVADQEYLNSWRRKHVTRTSPQNASDA